ncbi:YfiT family bacillithiol transferase [Sediminibacterium sp.]|uniref:YfiT family bacillithiol transferase n=1 Tax=Sediminibacterium sp. TaxID=1917865 RepID=UPI0025D9E836|nr:putative metal-dependent hydrolase [Sediminibacterium sp.]MBT9484844.1 putative metal-dependent hydrolase [Sediminibacterium sp.]
MINERYPIGQYEALPFSENQKNKWLADIQFLPEEVERALLNLDEVQLHTTYRNEGWTLHQVVHHLADSHMNAYCRFKLGLTEDAPIIKPYDENAWTLLNDVSHLPVNISVTLLHALHTRWYFAIKDLTTTQWERTVYHPGSKKEMSLWYLLGMYAWHGKHHTAHIKMLREKNNW